MRPVRPRLRAKARRGHPEAPAKRPREARRLAVAHEPRHVAHRDRGLLGEQLRRHRHPPREQILAEAALAELGIGSLKTARRSGDRIRHRAQRERLAIVALHHHARQQVQPAPGVDRRCAHAVHSDRAGSVGTRFAQT